MSTLNEHLDQRGTNIHKLGIWKVRITMEYMFILVSYRGDDACCVSALPDRCR